MEIRENKKPYIERILSSFYLVVPGIGKTYLSNLDDRTCNHPAVYIRGDKIIAEWQCWTQTGYTKDWGELCRREQISHGIREYDLKDAIKAAHEQHGFCEPIRDRY